MRTLASRIFAALTLDEKASAAVYVDGSRVLAIDADTLRQIAEALEFFDDAPGEEAEEDGASRDALTVQLGLVRNDRRPMLGTGTGGEQMATPRTAFVRFWLKDGTKHEGTILNPEKDYLRKIDRETGSLSFVSADGRGVVVACTDIEAFFVGNVDPLLPEAQPLLPGT